MDLRPHLLTGHVIPAQPLALDAQRKFSERHQRAIAVTNMNAALFDSANGFRGGIPGILEVLRRGGLVPTINCLNPHEVLSPGQAGEFTRLARAYPELTDDAFVAANRDKWFS